MKKVGRNDPCPCDSGKKYKQCCMQQNDMRAAVAHPGAGKIQQDLQAAFAQHMAGHLDEAERLYRQILQTEPKHAEALHLMGVLAGDRGDDAAAIELIGRAIRINASNHTYHANLGRIYGSRNEHAKAEACYRLAAALKPDSPHYYDDIGNALRTQDKFKEAHDNYRRALEINPAYASAHRNIGDLLQIQGKYIDAIASYRQAIALQPDLAQAVSNLGTTLQMQGKFAEAIDCFRKALAIEPNNAATHGNLLYALSIQDMPAHYLKEVSDYGLLLQSLAQAYTNWSYANLNSGQPLRVGLVSGDFRNHPVSFFLENLLAHLNPATVEVIAYPTTAKEDEVSARIKPYFSAWRPISNLSDRDAAQKIHADALHILIDLSGHTGNHRLPLFAWRPAP
ncbi:MAG TPA: tetratricopeptide repeat protein, partial [Spongiibacteraceae bacterium]|nr:tetratricopeptide repeat protein [Spongiibacteraceae bacterium]